MNKGCYNCGVMLQGTAHVVRLFGVYIKEVKLPKKIYCCSSYCLQESVTQINEKSVAWWMDEWTGNPDKYTGASEAVLGIENIGEQNVKKMS